MRAMSGNARYDASQELPPMNYAAFAEMAGLRGIRVERPEDIGAAWDSALSADRPVVIDAVVDPNVPPLPPHVTLEQSKAFLLSILNKDPERGRFLKQAIEQMFPTLAGRP
jgi:pyruvate dehydrogenase (quinone)